MALLGIVTAALFAALATIIAGQRRQMHELGAAELANRLILEYLDDKDSMPKAGLPIQYGGERYRWSMREVPVQITPAKPDIAAQRAAASSITIDRYVLVSFDVWLGEENGGSMNPEPGVPFASIARLVDPIALRNPDSNERMFRDQRRMQEFLDRMSRYSSGRSGGRRDQPSPVSPSSGPAGPSKGSEKK